MNQYSFNINNINASAGIRNVLNDIYMKSRPIIVCIGTDSCIGDSLGPVVGTILSETLGKKAYVYGTLKAPITAKETNLINNKIRMLHPQCKILVVDAAVGNKNDLGIIKISDTGIKPGLGVNKNLSAVGDFSIIGIVTEKNKNIDGLINNTRLGLIYKMAKIITRAITETYSNI